ncbi:MAG: DUF3426 domain-containing protein [Deltaproteobacteria bacterium]|nr:DUF3426 domain-containing protein [Deltaproteobacteria bacterium]
MIIRCIKCETSFRFDDQLMTGDGLWVRCSRCKDVFFQENLFREEDAGRPPEQDNKVAVLSSVATTSIPAPGAPTDNGETFPGKESDAVLSRIREIRGVLAEAAAPDVPLKEFDDRIEMPGAESAAEIGGAAAQRKAHPVARFFAYLLLVIFIVFFLGGIYLWLVPEGRQAAGDYLTPYFPGLESLVKGQLQLDPVAGQTGLQDVRQHFVNNWLMGSLRIVEGTAVNKGKYPLARLQVRGRLYDSGGNVLGEWQSFCGNILTDAELTTLTEAEIQRRLTQPLGSSFPNDRISPNGQIPFMVVIAHHDQQNVAKTTVMVSEVEKLLE